MYIVRSENYTFFCKKNTQDEWTVKQIFENHEYSIFNVKSDDIILDLGGHIGCFAIYMHNKVNRIYSYEPVYSNYILLTGNLEINNIKNVFLYKQAVTELETGKQKFYINISNGSDAHTFKNKNKSTYKETEIDAINIHELMSRHSDVNCIKMDIEHKEKDIIFELDRYFNRLNKIIFEWHFSNDDADLHDAAINLLKDKYKNVIEKLDGKTSIIYAE